MMLNLYLLLSKRRVLNRGREYRCNKDTERCIGQGQCKYTDIFYFHASFNCHGGVFIYQDLEEKICMYIFVYMY